MEFRTEVTIEKPQWQIRPADPLLLVGSCFADEMGRRFRDCQFCAEVNPFGVMYNPASLLHTVERTPCAPAVAMFTLGTNHVYRLRETGQIVDNCQKRPQRLFAEETLSVDQCAQYLQRAIDVLASRNPRVRVVITVSPIRYRKYGFHGSQLSKATLLLAAEGVVGANERADYFPAYELLCDELRDYRFYAPDMLHPSEQAVDYVWQRFADAYFSPEARQMVAEWQPIGKALSHVPFDPRSAEYQRFAAQTEQRLKAFRAKYGRPSEGG